MSRGSSVDALNSLSSELIAAAIEVHRTLGPGLLESVYETCLCSELRSRSVQFERQVPVPIVYKGQSVESDGLRLDLLVEGSVVVELKAVERVLPVHEAQLLTYLRLTDSRLGLLLNFNVVLLKEGIRRVVNNL